MAFLSSGTLCYTQLHAAFGSSAGNLCAAGMEKEEGARDEYQCALKGTSFPHSSGESGLVKG